MLSAIPNLIAMIPNVPIVGIVPSFIKIVYGAFQLSYVLITGYFGTLIHLITTGTLGASFWAAWPLLVKSLLTIINSAINIGTMGFFGFLFGI